MGSQLIIKSLNQIEKNFYLTNQDENSVTYAKINKNELEIKWNLPS